MVETIGKQKYNVLSIDGGGVRGLISLRIIAELEERMSNRNPNYKITQDVDLIIGTSAGGLIALALASGLSARTLVKIEEGSDEQMSIMEQIINKTFTEDATRDTFKESIYDGVHLEKALSTHLGTSENGVAISTLKISELRHLKANSHNPNLRVIVTTMQYAVATGQFTPTLIDSHADIGTAYTVDMAARSTSAAPTYFNGKRIDDQHFNYDGGVFANDPSLWGLFTACQCVPIEHVNIISVGTGSADQNKDHNDIQGNIDERLKRYKAKKGFYGSLVPVFIRKLADLLAWEKSVEIYDDRSGEKKGLKDWINIEVIEEVLAGIDSQVSHQFNAIKHLMGSFYRLNFQLEKKFDLDDVRKSSINGMNDEATKYLIDKSTLLDEIASKFSAAPDNLAAAAAMIQKVQTLLERQANIQTDVESAEIDKIVKALASAAITLKAINTTRPVPV